jgi:hypothetical protein
VDKDPTERPDESLEEQKQDDQPTMDPDPVADEDRDERNGPSVADAFRSG